MVNRVCRDCPIPDCGAKYLVKLSNHLTDVHQLDHIERRKCLQEAKLQPKVKVVVYLDSKEKNKLKYEDSIVYEPSLPRKPQQVQRRKKISRPRNVKRKSKKAL